MSTVYVSVSGGIAYADVVEGDVTLLQIDWDNFDDVDLTDSNVEESMLYAYQSYAALPIGSAVRATVRGDLLDILRRRRRQIESDERAENERREREIANARKVLAAAGEA